MYQVEEKSSIYIGHSKDSQISLLQTAVPWKPCPALNQAPLFLLLYPSQEGVQLQNKIAG